MKAIVTAVHGDGAKWGWPDEPVFRFRSEDGSWAWVPQLAGRHHAVGDIIQVDGGWEWLDTDERAAKLAALKRESAASRAAGLRQMATRLDVPKLPPKTPGQLDREIAEALGIRRRRKQ